MTEQLPPVPQTGRIPITLLPEQERKLLRSTVKADRTDPFATDANDEVRHLGKLALRRDEPDPTDSFALGDLCARLSLSEDHALLILYIGKALLAYRRAGMQSTREVDHQAADQACERFILWVIQAAQTYPTQRNSAAALW